MILWVEGWSWWLDEILTKESGESLTIYTYGSTLFLQITGKK